MKVQLKSTKLLLCLYISIFCILPQLSTTQTKGRTDTAGSNHSLAATDTADVPFQLLVQKIKNYTITRQQEKIHLQLDKPYYAANDHIWLKAYVINSVSAFASSISGVMYVELINSQDSVQQRLTLPVIAGVSWGSFALPDSLREGNYRVRAYTNWMKNAGPEYFYDQMIRIGNLRARSLAGMPQPAGQKVNHKQVAPIAGRSSDIRFFPESGNLVDGLTSKVGIKATLPSGRGETVTGSVTDETGKEVATIANIHLGIGSFKLTPQAGKTYTARITEENGSVKTIPLPAAVASGFVFSADQDDSRLMIRISMSDELVNRGQLKLLVLHNGSLFNVLRIDHYKQHFSTILQKNQYPSGILQLTLLDPLDRPVAERLVFVKNPSDVIATSVTSDKKTYQTGEAVQLDLAAKLDGKPVQGAFSVAVTNATFVKPDELNESNIFGDLLLRSDLKGYIEQPAYYFLNDSTDTRRNLDNLMLTQGWRRVIWKNGGVDMGAANTEQPQSSLVIGGVVTNENNKASPGNKVTLLEVSGKGNSRDTVTDKHGNFVFDNLFFPDSTEFIIQARKLKNKRGLIVKLTSPSYSPVTSNKISIEDKPGINDSLMAYLKQSEIYFNELEKMGRLNRVHVLQEVKIVEKENPAKNSANLNGPGVADYLFTTKDLQAYTSVADALNGKIAGVYFKDGVPFLARDRTAAMQVYVDGFKIDVKQLSQVVLFNVQTIEILTDLSKTAVYGQGAANSGVMIITTKRGNENIQQTKTPDIIVAAPKGYDVSREFYSPVYTPDKAGQLTDHRLTVYWNPNLITGPDGQLKLNYYNAGVPGVYRVVIEGTDLKGSFTHSVFTYEVK